MKELSLHILDITMNSIKAQAKLIELSIEENIKKNLIKITIKDDGKGMSKETLEHVTDPFYTTRTTRKVGLGLPLLKESAQRSGGDLKIQSKLGEGTTVEATFERDNIDRAPLGNLGDTMMVMINSLDDCELIYKHKVNDEEFILSTMQMKEILEVTDLNSNDVLLWAKEYVNENLDDLYKSENR